MGLDITAYKNISLIKSAPLDDEDYDTDGINGIVLYPVEGFISYTDGLVEGVYTTQEEELSFRAGSYSSYNRWREQLARVINLTPQAIWDNPNQSLPFIELINNSDEEGFIGPKTCKKLADDFRKMREEAEKKARKYWPNESDTFLKLYDHWTEAFEYASDGGVVKFH